MRSPSEKRDKNRFCDFHNEIGHRTDECRHLLWEIENQIRNGKLKEYVAAKPRGEKVARVEDQQQAKDSDVDLDIGAPATIFVIHAETAVGGLSNTERKRRLHELYSLYSHPPKREPTNVPSINFGDQDMHGIKYPHDDALVASVIIGDFAVRRVLIDNRSSANVLFSDAYHKMEPIKPLQNTTSIMTDFAGDVRSPLGKLELLVSVGEGALKKSTRALFFVVKAASPYNAILGRSWLYAMQVIPSTLHQCLKYPVSSVIGTLIGDLISARECHAAALKNK